ncbi:ATP-dependent helicase [Escherichia coli]|nr:ATP-dependent helicase [Escherichia coli]
MRRAGIINAGAHSGPSHPALATTLRASQLLEIAQGYPDFPVILETLRECLQDVYDLPALERLMRRLNGGEIQISDGNDHYALAFRHKFIVRLCRGIYVPERRPLAERRASVLSLDSELLRNLLGQVDPGGITRPAGSFARWKKSCNDWLLAEERKVKKDCSTCCANWGQ